MNMARIKGIARTCNPFCQLARLERFELPTYGFVVRCSIQLSYKRMIYVAEREGFEPSIPVYPVYSLSRRAPSASRPSLLTRDEDFYLYIVWLMIARNLCCVHRLEAIAVYRLLSLFKVNQDQLGNRLEGFEYSFTG